MTLVIAIVGALTGITSIVWQIWAFKLVGSRVTVELVQVWLGASGAVVGAVGSFKDGHPPAQDLDVECWGIRVRNRGRSKTSVSSCSIEVGAASAIPTNGIYNRPLPYTLEAEHDATWVVERAFVNQGAAALVERRGVIRASCQLGSGRTIKSPNSVPLP